MKKTQIKNGVKIFILTLLAVIVTLAGIYLHLIGSLFEDMKKREYNEYTFNIPSSENTLIVKEWVAFRTSGDEFYIKKPDGKMKLLDKVCTDEECPFADNSYKFVWSDDSVTISYKFNGDVWKDITLSLS